MVSKTVSKELQMKLDLFFRVKKSLENSYSEWQEIKKKFLP